MSDIPNINQKQKISTPELKRIPGVLFNPGREIREIAVMDRPYWLTPLVVLSVLLVVLALVSGPIKKQGIEMGTNLPPDFQYYSPEMQQQFLEAQAAQSSAVFLYIFPILFGVVGIWLTWFILGSLLHLLVTLYGSRSKNTRSLNLAAWSFAPFTVRTLVQIGAVLFSKSLVANPGLSGLLSASATGFLPSLGRAVLGFIDVYFIYQVILLFIGVVPLSGLKKGRAWAATAITVLILLLIKAIPGLLSSLFSGLSFTRPFFF